MQWIRYAIALLALCCVAPASIEIGLIDISLQTLVILLLATFFNPIESFVLLLSYLVIGALGLPVYSGYVGGYDKLIGNTAGFFIGFVLASVFLNYFIVKVKFRLIASIFLFACAHVLILLTGFVWMHITIPELELVSVLLPLLPALALKSLLGGLIGSIVQKKWNLRA